MNNHTSPQELGHGGMPGSWDTAYEWRAIGLLSLGFGLVAFDRFLILPMFPVIMRDLDLNYGDLGNITGALALTWGLSAFLMGRVSDRWGRRKIVVGSMVTFSLLVGLSGLATGAASLILIRAMMGTAEGAYVPPSIAATLESARPEDGPWLRSTSSPGGRRHHGCGGTAPGKKGAWWPGR